MKGKFLKFTRVIVTTIFIASLLFLDVTSSIGEYDSWKDLNDDGYINIKDVALLGSVFATSGDPVKNVNVANLKTTKLDYETHHLGRINITSGRAFLFSFPDWNTPVFCGGFSRVSVYYLVDDLRIGTYTLTISLAEIAWFNSPPGQDGEYGGPFTHEPINALNLTVERDNSGWSAEHIQPILVETKAPYFTLDFRTNTDAVNWWDIWVVVDVYIYLRSD